MASARDFELYMDGSPYVEQSAISGIGAMICATDSDQAWVLTLEAVLEQFVPATPDRTASEHSTGDTRERTITETVERLMLGRSA